MRSLKLNNLLLYAFTGFYSDVKHGKAHVKKGLIILIALFTNKPIKVLLADDDADDREIFMTAMKDFGAGIEISVAKNGEELMTLLNKTGHLPDIIFLDLNMPVKNGQECLEEIRSNEMLKNIPVIIYSTSSSREHIEETFRNGGSLYLTKPDSLNELKLIARQIFSLDWQNFIRPKIEKYVLSTGRIK